MLEAMGSNQTVFELLQANKLNVPNSEFLPNTRTKIPFVLIADEAFPLLKDLMKPYPKDQLQDRINENYNQRLSRARECVECAFGIIRVKWRILTKEIETKEETDELIVKAICVLHNTIIDTEGIERDLSNFSIHPHQEEYDNQIIGGHHLGRQSNDANKIQEEFKEILLGKSYIVFSLNFFE